MTDIKETATAVNYTLMKLISLQAENSAENQEKLRPLSGNGWSIHWRNIYGDFVAGETSLTACELDLPSVVDVLTQYIMHNSVQTKVAVLRWIHDLYIKIPTKVSSLVMLIFAKYCSIFCLAWLKNVNSGVKQQFQQTFKNTCFCPR